MNITKVAVAGTLESSDVLVRIEPFSNGVDIEINSSVGKQFGDDIRKTTETILAQLHINNVQIIIEDKGALDCVLQARIKAALMRATDDEINWEIML